MRSWSGDRKGSGPSAGKGRRSQGARGTAGSKDRDQKRGRDREMAKEGGPRDRREVQVGGRELDIWREMRRQRGMEK